MRTNPEFTKILSELEKNYPELTDEQIFELATWNFNLAQLLVRLYISSRRKD